MSKHIIAYAGPRTFRFFDDMYDAKRWADEIGGPVTFYKEVTPTEPFCTGLTANWCPNCGDCCCEREQGLDNPDCPLHTVGSPHPYAHIE